MIVLSGYLLDQPFWLLDQPILSSLTRSFELIAFTEEWLEWSQEIFLSQSRRAEGKNLGFTMLSGLILFFNSVYVNPALYFTVPYSFPKMAKIVKEGQKIIMDIKQLKKKPSFV